MANPQKEDGHIRIANKIWDALCRIRISGEARQVLDVILRQTYGYNKKKDGIELSKFVEMTGMIKTHVSRNIKKLEGMGLIIITQKGNKYWNEYEFVKDFEKWQPLPKKVTLPKKVKALPKKVKVVTQKGNSLYTNKTNNRTNRLETVSKNFDADSFFLLAWAEYPVKRGSKSKALSSYRKTVAGEQSHQRLMETMAWYVTDCNSRNSFKMNGQTFFNQWESIEENMKEQPILLQGQTQPENSIFAGCL